MSLTSDVAELQRKMDGLLKLAEVTRPGKDDADYPIQQLGWLGRAGDGVMWFPYGMHANIPADELAIVMSMQGKAEGRIAFPGSPKSRPKECPEGEVVFYHPKTGSSVRFRNSGDIEITTESAVTVTAPTATFTGDVQVDGDLAVDGDIQTDSDLTVDGDTALGATVTSNSKDISDTHTHIGSLTAPIGLQSNTGVPV